MGRKIPMWQCFVVMLAMVAFLIWSIVKDSGGEPHIALILAAIVAGIVAVANGWKWAYLEQGMLASINRSMQAILILAILGCLIASWMAAGGMIFFSSTRFTLIPQGSVAISNAARILVLMISLEVSVSSSSISPMMFLSVVAVRFSMAIIGFSTP